MARGANKDPEGAAAVKSLQAAAVNVKAVEQSEVASLQAHEARADAIAADLQVMGRHKPPAGKWYSINPGSDYWQYLRQKRVRFYRAGSRSDPKAVADAALLKAQGWFEVDSQVHCSGFERHRPGDILLAAYPSTYAHVIRAKVEAKQRAMSVRKAKNELRHPSVQKGMSDPVRRAIERGDVHVQDDSKHIEVPRKDLGKAAQDVMSDVGASRG